MREIAYISSFSKVLFFIDSHHLSNIKSNSNKSKIYSLTQNFGDIKRINIMSVKSVINLSSLKINYLINETKYLQHSIISRFRKRHFINSFCAFEVLR